MNDKPQATPVFPPQHAVPQKFHCHIYIQIHGEHSLLPSSSVKKHSRLVAHDVVSLAECLVPFGGTQKDDCKVKML